MTNNPLPILVRMSVQHVTIDDTPAWFLAGEDDVMVGDVLDLFTTPGLRVRFGRYNRGAEHEWIVTHDETLIITKGTLRVRFSGGEQVARAGELVALSKGTRVVYRGEEDETEVVFVTHAHWADAPRRPTRPELVEDARGTRAGPRPVPTYTIGPAAVRRGA
jgi:ethanolamine utilization protein EutQ (cupin superfamily)